LLNSVADAIDAVRGFTITFGVFGPSVVTANVTGHIGLAAGYLATPVYAAVNAAIAAYIGGLPLGASLSWSRLIQVAYDASPGVANISGLQINGAADDIAATPKQVIRPGTVAVGA
jgi:uncharacterized phage protein gp47/JayE